MADPVGADPAGRQASAGEPPAAGGEALPSAADLEQIAETSAKQKEEDRRKNEREAEQAKRAEIEALRKPVPIAEDEVKDLIESFRRAAEQGMQEYVVFSFPAEVLEDRGRAINNAEPGWPSTLAGKARGYYEAWDKYLKDKGYKISARVSRFTADGLVGDISLVIAW
jgi:hypothetical protein